MVTSSEESFGKAVTPNLCPHPDLCQPNSNEFIHEFKWTFVPKLKRFPPDFPEISHQPEWVWWGRPENAPLAHGGV